MTRIGLVLGAGGVAGQAYHAGVLAALEDGIGWDARSAEVIVGTSAGSIVAALLRAGVTSGELVSGSHRQHQAGPDRAVDEESAAVAVTATLVAPGPGRARLGGRLAGWLPEGTRSPDGIVAMVQQVAGDRWPDRPTHVCAVRRRDGRRVVFGLPGAPPAPLSRAVAASCAIPGYFQPVRIGDEAYVDGGAHSPTNLDLLAGRGLDVVVVSSPMSVARRALQPRVDLPARLLFRATLAREALAVRRSGTPVVTLQPAGEDLGVMGLNAMDPRPWRDVVARARASTRRRLADPAVRALLTR